MTASRWLWAVVPAVLVPAALLTILASLDESEGLWFLGRLLYWSMPVLVLLAAAAGLWRLREAGFRMGDFRRRNGAGLGLALGLTAACFALVPPEMRVQWDEANLQSAAKNMHERRACFVAIGAVPFDGEPSVLELMVDKRPPLFPFLVSLLHDASGFRLANAFAVNALILLVLLAVVHGATRSRADAARAFAAPFLVLSVPLTLICATSAGFELLSATLLAVVVLAAADLVRQPTRPRLAWLLAAGTLLAYTRYESVAVFAVVLGLALWLARRRWREPGRSLALGCLLPGVLTPLALQLLHSADPDFYSEAGGAQALVSLGHAVAHLPGFLATFFDPGFRSPFAGALAWLAAVVVAGKLARREWSRLDTLLVAPVALATFVALLWFYGDAREPSAQRLYLPVALLAALAPLWLLKPVPRGLPAAAVAVAVVGFCGVRVLQVRTRAAFPKLEVVELADAVEETVAEVPDPGTTLFVSSVAQHLVLKGYSAVTPATFRRHEGSIERLRLARQVREVLFVRTPLDEQLGARQGSLEELMKGYVTEAIPGGAGDVPIVAHRLLRKRRF